VQAFQERYSLLFSRSLSDWRNGKAAGTKPQRTEAQICTAQTELINTFTENVLKLTLLVQNILCHCVPITAGKPLYPTP
jgi:hypothetical protein